jgi:hypothetical protein
VFDILPAKIPISKSAHIGIARRDCVNGSGGVRTIATTKQLTMT